MEVRAPFEEARLVARVQLGPKRLLGMEIGVLGAPLVERGPAARLVTRRDE